MRGGKGSLFVSLSLEKRWNWNFRIVKHNLVYIRCCFGGNELLFTSSLKLFDYLMLIFGRGTALQVGMSRVLFPMVSLECFSAQPLTGRSSWNISLWGRGDKGGRSVGLTTLAPLCGDWKSGNLKLLEASGPVEGLLHFYLFHVVLSG